MHRNLSDAQVQLCINRYVKDECKTTHTINLNIGYNGIYKNENNFFGKINAISIGLSHEFQKRNLWSVKFKYTNLGFAANTQTGITNTYSCEKYTTNDSLSQQHLLSAAIGLMNYIANNQSVLMALSDGILGKMENQNTTIMHYEEAELKEIKETYSNSTYDVCVKAEAMYEYHIKYNLFIGTELYGSYMMDNEKVIHSLSSVVGRKFMKKRIIYFNSTYTLS